MDHLDVDIIQGEGGNQRVRVSGDGTMFPLIQALLHQIGFIKREDEHDRCSFPLLSLLYDAVLTWSWCAIADRFRPNMVSIKADLLFEYMRAHSSHLHGATQRDLMANLKKFLVEQSELAATTNNETCSAAGGTKSAFGGKTLFSPKKPKGPDARPAILARKTWTIKIDCKRGIVTVGGDLQCCH